LFGIIIFVEDVCKNNLVLYVIWIWLSSYFG